MRVVLPGEADAAERLHAVLGVEERGVERERGGRPRSRARRRCPRRRRRGPRPTTAPRASSVRASMSAHRCFTPWNWPIGRPNCTRTFAYSAAVSTHHCATPIASAASSTAARSCTRAEEIARSRRRRPERPRRRGRARATGRREVDAAAPPPGRRPSASSTAPQRRRPRTPTTSAIGATEHGRGAPPSRDRAPVISPGSPSRGQQLRGGRASGLLRGSRPRAPSARYGPGAHARPSSSSTTACSTRPYPAPPCVFGHVQAEPARLAERGPERRAGPWRRRPRPARPRAGCGVSTKRRTAWRSSSCSSVIPMAMTGSSQKVDAPVRSKIGPSGRRSGRQVETIGPSGRSRLDDLGVAVEHGDRLGRAALRGEDDLVLGRGVGSSDDRDAVVVEVEHAGAQNEQLPDPMQASRSILMSSATRAPDVTRLAKPTKLRSVRGHSARHVTEPVRTARRCSGCQAGDGSTTRCGARPARARRPSRSRARPRAGRGTRRRARRLREPRTRGRAGRCSRRGLHPPVDPHAAAGRDDAPGGRRARPRSCGGSRTPVASSAARARGRGAVREIEVDELPAPGRVLQRHALAARVRNPHGHARGIDAARRRVAEQRASPS